MAKIVLTINANNKATESVRLLNAEVQTLSKTLSSIKVNKNLTAQINALTKHYTALAKAAVRVNEATTKRQIAEQRLVNEVKRGRTEDQRTLKVKAQKEQAELRLKQAQDKATQSTQKATTATKQNTEVNKEHRQSILSMTRGILEWQIATTLVMKPLRALRDALASINETLVKTEDSVIALQRVLPQGSATDGEISSRLYKIAQNYGQTFDNVSQIAENFARTGMSWADTIKATEAAVFALNVAELDAEEATNGLIAILSQFGLEASDLETVIDKLNKTADNFPVTTEKILAALQRTGSAADNANLSLDQTIALITALSKATGRSGENIGTALNSLIQYSSKASALETFANLSEESAKVVAQYRQGGATILDVWKQVSKEIQNLKSDQADLLDNYFNTDDGNALKEALDGELEDIYTELGGVYDTANTFRKNYFIALLGNMETVEQAMGTLQGAAGYSQAENQKYLDTYTAKLNTLKAQWEKLANSAQGILGIKKFLVDIGSGIVWLMDKTGGLRTTFIALGTVLTTIAGGKIVSGIAKLGKSFASLLHPVKTFNSHISQTKKVQDAQRLATELQEKANTAAARAIHYKNSANTSSENILKAETIATEAQTAATEAQVIADKEATLASKARASAIKTIVGLIGAAATVGSIVYGIIDKVEQSSKQAAEEAQQRREDIISEWEAIQDEALAFADLNKQYLELKNTSNRTTEQENKFLDVQKNIVDTLGYKAIALKKLAEGTTEYQQKLEELTKAEVDSYAKQAQAAANAAKESYKYTVTKDNFHNLIPVLAGMNINDYVFDFNDPVGSLDNYLTYLYDNGKKDSDEYDRVYSYYEKIRDAYETYITAEAKNTSWEYRRDNGIPQTQDEIDALVNTIIKSTGATERWRDTIEGVVVELTGFKAPKKNVDDWANNITKVKDEYDDLIKKLEELRDLQKESTEWEEKKLAVMEAEQAFENAKNEATVRRFNQAAGQWEWQTDEKAVKEAEENLQKAQLNLQESAYNNIIEQLKEENATNDSILAILKEVAPLLGEDFVETVKNAIKDKTNVDLDRPVNSKEKRIKELKQQISDLHLSGTDLTPYFNSVENGQKTDAQIIQEYENKLKELEGSVSHDNGGLALGKGFINKATDRPESVNNPELTRKILSPVSNAEFNRYVRDMGIMFERSHQYAQMPVIERVGGATDNRVDNSGQITMNGVTIGADKRGSSLNELLSLANIVPNV